MSERLPIGILTSKEHKAKAFSGAMASYGVPVVWVKMPDYFPEPDHIKNEAMAAKEKLLWFALALGREEIARQVPELYDMWRILIMDVSGNIVVPDSQNGGNNVHTMTTCRNVSVAAEMINGTAKLLLASKTNDPEWRKIVWSNSVATARQTRGGVVDQLSSRVSHSSLEVNTNLAQDMETGKWYSTTRHIGNYRGFPVINHKSSGGIDWTKLPIHLRAGQEMRWTANGKTYQARGNKFATPDIEDGMLESMSHYLRGVPDQTAKYLSRLT